MLMKLGSIIGSLGLVGFLLAALGGANLNIGAYLLIIGLILMIVGFFRGESRP